MKKIYSADCDRDRRTNRGLLKNSQGKQTTLLQKLTAPALSIILCSLVGSACGVKGKPQPPLTPAELGRGKPTFSRGTEEFAFPAVPTPSSVPDRKATPDHEGNG